MPGLRPAVNLIIKVKKAARAAANKQQIGLLKSKNAAAGNPSRQKLENKGKILDLSFFSPIIFDHKFALKNQIFNGPRTPPPGQLDAWGGRGANLILKVNHLVRYLAHFSIVKIKKKG